jgi:hypothetical protein
MELRSNRSSGDHEHQTRQHGLPDFAPVFTIQVYFGFMRELTGSANARPDRPDNDYDDTDYLDGVSGDTDKFRKFAQHRMTSGQSGLGAQSF